MINHAHLLLDGHPGVTQSSDRCFSKPRQPLLNTRSEPAVQNMMNMLESQAKSMMSSGKSRDINGHKRSRDQVMFDLLAQWCTGTPNAQGASKVNLVLLMTPQTLLGEADTTAWLAGHGPIPADIAREWLADRDLKVFLQRLFSDPTATQLLNLESRGRAFPLGLRRMLLMRDNGCRNPFCEASIKDGDHIKSVAKGGQTTFANGSGLCGHCNQLKENRGWQHIGDGQSLTVTTPTGHRYTRTPAPLIPGQAFEAEPTKPSGQSRPQPITNPTPRQTRSPHRRRQRIEFTQYLRC